MNLPRFLELRRRRRGFILLDTLLGVTIFAVGVLFLGQAVNNCLDAQSARTVDQRARLALENRLAEIEAGIVELEDEVTTETEGMFSGITIRQTREALEEYNEEAEALTGLWLVTLTAGWESWGQPQKKQLTFYVYRER